MKYTVLYTYDGNEQETYTIFRNGKEVGKLAISEDEAIEVVAALNLWRRNFG
jgi:hypothetical protein